MQVDSLRTEDKFKKTEIGEIPVDWEIVNLGETVRLQGGFAFESSDYKERGVPLVRISNVTSSGIILNECVYLPASSAKEFSDFLLEDGDVLVAMSGATTGKIGVVSKKDLPALFNQRVGRFMIEDSNRIAKRYLGQVVLTKRFKEDLLIDAAGGAQPNVSGKSIERVVIPLPPLPEQEKIAEILSSVDEAIEKRKEIIEKTKELKRGLMQELLTRGIGHKKFKKTKIGKIPVDWEVKKIKDMCILGRGRVISQKEINLNPGPYPVFSSQSKNEGIMGFIGSYDFNGEYVTWTTDGAYAGTVFYRKGQFNCTNVCGTLQSKVDFVDMKFLAYALQKSAKTHVVQCGNPKLMNNVMAQISVQVAPLAEQRKIAKILSSVDEKIEKQGFRKERLESIKKGLVQILFTGKVRVKA